MSQIVFSISSNKVHSQDARMCMSVYVPGYVQHCDLYPHRERRPVPTAAFTDYGRSCLQIQNTWEKTGTLFTTAFSEANSYHWKA